MTVEPDLLLRIQAGALSGQDLDTFTAQLAGDARLVRDGRVVGRGPEAARKLLREEYAVPEAGAELSARLERLDGEPVVVQYMGAEGHREPRAVYRFALDDERITECRITHDAAIIDRLVRSATPTS